MSDDNKNKSRLDELVASVESDVQDFRQGITEQATTDIARLLERIIALELKVEYLEQRLAPGFTPEPNPAVERKSA